MTDFPAIIKCVEVLHVLTEPDYLLSDPWPYQQRAAELALR